MKSYPTATALDKHSLADFAPSSRWSLKDRLARTRGGNHWRTTGAGARRRSAYEHQLDDHLEILRAFDTPGAVLVITRNARLGKSDGARLAARARAAVLPRQALEPRALLSEAQSQPRSGVAGLRWELERRLTWARENHPARAGWALKQSGYRATDNDKATEFYLPRRSWPAFTIWRRVMREIVRLLLPVHQLLSLMIPLRRRLASTALPEKTAPDARTARQAGTTLGDHGRAPVAAAWFLARRFPDM